MSYHKEITRDNGRIFVCGDLHGEIDKLYEKLDEVDFDYDTDLLISPGDLVDRGQDSLACFNLIYKSWFMATKGNHEAFCEDVLLDGINKEALSHNHIRNGGDWFYDLPTDVQIHIATEISKMPVVLTLNRKGKKYGFIHADIPYHLRSWDEIVKGAEEGSDRFIYSLIWGRSRIKNFQFYDAGLVIDGIDRIYLGHTVIKSQTDIGNTTYIDTGACFGATPGYGTLTMVEIQ